MGLSDSASAGLIFNSLRYDGHVRSNGTQGTEKHLTDNGFPPISPPAAHPLPAEDPDPPNPLNAAIDLSIFSYIETVGGLGTTPYGEVWIRRPGGGDLFANPLDTTLAIPPIELEVEVYLDGIDDSPGGDKLIFPHIGAEQFGSFPPHPSPADVEILSGRGTPADPLRVLLRLTAGQADMNGNRGEAKVRFYYDTMQVPEPAALALAGLGGVGVLGLARRRRRN